MGADGRLLLSDLTWRRADGHTCGYHEAAPRTCPALPPQRVLDAILQSAETQHSAWHQWRRPDRPAASTQGLLDLSFHRLLPLIDVFRSALRIK